MPKRIVEVKMDVIVITVDERSLLNDDDYLAKEIERLIDESDRTDTLIAFNVSAKTFDS